MANRICSISGCESKVMARGWCSKHYQRWQHHGDPVATGIIELTRAIDHEDSTRTCTGCGERMPLESFDVDRTAALGRRSQCSTCRGVKMQAWYEANQNRQMLRARDRFMTNGDQIRAQDMARYLRHREQRIELATEHSHLKRARKQGVAIERGITVTALRALHGDVCPYCEVTMAFEKSTGHDLVPTKASVEHVVAMALGGGHTWANTMLCCLGCNMAKKNMTVEEWDAKRKTLREDRASALDAAS